MSVHVYRESTSTDLIVRVSEYYFSDDSKPFIAEKVASEVTSFLAKEYTTQHQQEILAQIDLKAIINSLSIKIAEEVTKNLLGKNNAKT